MNTFDPLQLSRAYHLAHALGHPWAVNFSCSDILKMTTEQLTRLTPDPEATAHPSYYTVQERNGTISYQGRHIGWEVTPNAVVTVTLNQADRALLIVTLEVPGTPHTDLLRKDEIELEHLRLLERALRELLFPEELTALLTPLRAQALENEKSTLMRGLHHLNRQLSELASNDDNGLWSTMQLQTRAWIEGVRAI